jgi:hypothetical protein
MFINHLSLLFHNFYDGLNTENGNFHKFYWALTKASITLSQPDYDMMLISWKKKSSVELPFSSFGDHLINILRKVNRLIYAFKIN